MSLYGISGTIKGNDSVQDIIANLASNIFHYFILLAINHEVKSAEGLLVSVQGTETWV